MRASKLLRLGARLAPKKMQLIFTPGLHGSCHMYRPCPFTRAHKQEASGEIYGTINSPKVCLKGCESGPE